MENVVQSRYHHITRYYQGATSDIARLPGYFPQILPEDNPGYYQRIIPDITNVDKIVDFHLACQQS
jgi:hypothetical protein